MSYSVGTQVALLKANVGFHEGAHNANPYSLDQYGVARPFGGWCCSFASYCAYKAGFVFWSDCTFGAKGENNAGRMREAAQRHGIWRSSGATARPGWLAPMDFTEPDQHIETVISDTGGPFVATIGGNTNDQVAYRLRPRHVIEGFVALDEAGQNAPGPTPTPKEVKTMGTVAMCVVPGAHAQTAPPNWVSHIPSIAVVHQADNSWDICGMNGAELKEQNRSGFGLSVQHFDHLNAPIVSIEPVNKEIELEGNKVLKWTGDIVALAADGGTFHVHPTVHYVS